MIWSSDVARRLVDDPAIFRELVDSREPDDVALSTVLERMSSYTAIPRLDCMSRTFPACGLHVGAGVHWSQCVPHVTHVRFEGLDRPLDAIIMDWFQEAVAAHPGLDPMLGVHAAQSMAVAAAAAAAFTH